MASHCKLSILVVQITATPLDLVNIMYIHYIEPTQLLNMTPNLSNIEGHQMLKYWPFMQSNSLQLQYTPFS